MDSYSPPSPPYPFFRAARQLAKHQVFGLFSQMDSLRQQFRQCTRQINSLLVKRMALTNNMEVQTARKLKAFVFQKDRAVFIEETQRRISTLRQKHRVLLAQLFFSMTSLLKAYRESLYRAVDLFQKKKQTQLARESFACLLCHREKRKQKQSREQQISKEYNNRRLAICLYNLRHFCLKRQQDSLKITIAQEKQCGRLLRTTLFALVWWQTRRVNKKIGASIAYKAHRNFMKFKVFKEFKQLRQKNYQTQLSQLLACRDRLQHQDLLRYDFTKQTKVLGQMQEFVFRKQLNGYLLRHKQRLIGGRTQEQNYKHLTVPRIKKQMSQTLLQLRHIQQRLRQEDIPLELYSLLKLQANRKRQETKRWAQQLSRHHVLCCAMNQLHSHELLAYRKYQIATGLGNRVWKYKVFQALFRHTQSRQQKLTRLAHNYYFKIGMQAIKAFYVHSQYHKRIQAYYIHSHQSRLKAKVMQCLVAFLARRKALESIVKDRRKKKCWQNWKIKMENREKLRKLFMMISMDPKEELEAAFRHPFRVKKTLFQGWRAVARERAERKERQMKYLMAINHHSVSLEYKAFQGVKRLGAVIRGVNTLTKAFRGAWAAMAFGELFNQQNILAQKLEYAQANQQYRICKQVFAELKTNLEVGVFRRGVVFRRVFLGWRNRMYTINYDRPFAFYSYRAKQRVLIGLFLNFRDKMHKRTSHRKQQAFLAKKEKNQKTQIFIALIQYYLRKRQQAEKESRVRQQLQATRMQAYFGALVRWRDRSKAERQITVKASMESHCHPFTVQTVSDSEPVEPQDTIKNHYKSITLDQHDLPTHLKSPHLHSSLSYEPEVNTKYHVQVQVFIQINQRAYLQKCFNAWYHHHLQNKYMLQDDSIDTSLVEQGGECSQVKEGGESSLVEEGGESSLVEGSGVSSLVGRQEISFDDLSRESESLSSESNVMDHFDSLADYTQLLGEEECM